jgi:hypothetical protein
MEMIKKEHNDVIELEKKAKEEQKLKDQLRKEEQERLRNLEEQEEENAGYGDIRLSFLNKIDPKIMTFAGIGLIVVMFLVMIWALKGLLNKQEAEKTKKNKKKVQ